MVVSSAATDYAASPGALIQYRRFGLSRSGPVTTSSKMPPLFSIVRIEPTLSSSHVTSTRRIPSFPWAMCRARRRIAVLLVEHLEVATEGHPFLVIMEEVRDFRRGRAMCPHELVFLVLSRPATHERFCHN